jgi:hypothetical protein
MFHYNYLGVALCGKKVESRYLEQDWKEVDCRLCKLKEQTFKEGKIRGKAVVC